MSLKLSDLKKLHDKGFSLLYLHEKEKRPFDMGWAQAPRPKWDELENSFEKNYNVGVRLGKPSKLISGKYLGVIDCDVKSVSRKAKLEMNDALRKLGIDLTSAPIVMSGRGNGSKHIYVQTVEPIKPMKFAQSEKTVKVPMPGEKKPHSKRELKRLTEAERDKGYRIRSAWEISFMGTGQQVVLPPSIHPDTGMKYAWANPLSVKYLPTFEPSKFVSQIEKKEVADRELNFKAEDVNLYESKLSLYMVRLIEEGRDCEDRSAGLFSAALAMCRVGFTDNQILSVLSNEDYWIASAAYEHTKSSDRGRAVRWLHKYTLLKARYETDIMRRFENQPIIKKLNPEKAAKQKENLDEDLNKVLPDLDGNGKPKPSLRNMVHILEEWMGGGLIGFNEFSGRPYFLKDTPYGGVKGKEVADHDDLALKHYTACHYRFEPTGVLCFEAHQLVARKHRYHPVKDYLEGLEWDGEERLDGWLESAFRASAPNEYLCAVSRKVLVAAVARIYQPGCKFDYVTVLEGLQGKGKSMSLGILASPSWFTDGLGDIHNKDVVDQMTGKWVIELSELASIRGKENEHIKSFLTRQVDRVRMSYGRRSEDYPRQSIFIGSTNSSEYFTDETGNRRYWPVKVGRADRRWILENRDQLWAEALVRYRLGEKLYLPTDLEKVAAKEQEKRFEVDVWEEEIRGITEKDAEGTFVTTELWRAINIDRAADFPSMNDCKRIGKIMQRLKYRKSAKRVDGVLTKCWTKSNLVRLER